MSPRIYLSLPALFLSVGGFVAYNLPRSPGAQAADRPGNHPRIPILLFHEVDGKGPYAISRQDFRRYLEILKEEDVTVLPLKQVYEMAKAGRPADRPSVAITIDDDFKNIVRVAAPILREYNYPATFFVYTRNIVDQPRQGMAWEDLRRLLREGFDVQNHSHTHTAFHVPRGGESQAEFANRVNVEIVQSKRLIEENLPGHKIWAFAYPMGYHSPYLESRLREEGYTLLLQTDAIAPDVRRPFKGIFDRFTIERGGSDPVKLFRGQIEIARRTIENGESVSLQNGSSESPARARDL